MSSSRLFVLSAVLGLALLLPACAPETDAVQPSPTRVSATPTATPAKTPTPSPTPTRTLSATAGPTTRPAVVSCDAITTEEFRAAMRATGWISWETQDGEIGAKPFALFPDGAPEGQIVCRWGLSPDITTDNVVDLAWAPIDSENAVAAMQILQEQGFTRIDAGADTYWAKAGTGDSVDAEGWGTTYFFTRDDVRWAPTKADVAYLTAPVGN